MILRYTNGSNFQGVILFRTESTIRVAQQGSEDVVEFTRLNGMWVSDDLEPAWIEYASSPAAAAPELPALVPQTDHSLQVKRLREQVN
jgi:hypothetical protein